MENSNRPVIAWYLADGKPGHENQIGGLLQALACQVPVKTYDIAAPPGWCAALEWGIGIFSAAKGLPEPDIIVGAGHATHVPLLTARRARGGRTVVLMRPGLPSSWYDLCLIPEHDGVAPAANILLTRGVLNSVASGGIHHPARGLILLGGPSRHYNWDSSRILQQIETIAQQERDCQWVLSTSRRTPSLMLPLLRNLRLSNLEVFSYDVTPSSWVAEQLALAGQVWVSEDSVSMVYEALTSGAAVGVLSVPCKAWDRVVRGVDSLAEKGLVTPFTAWYQGQLLTVPSQQFNEAARCAQVIVKRWLSDH